MWLRDVDGAILCDVARLVAVVLEGAGVRVCVVARMPAGRVVVEELRAFGFGVTLVAIEGNLDFF